jgi:hypothetical protein
MPYPASSTLRRLLVAAVLLTPALPAAATTIVPVADGRLVDRSPAIALVTVEAKLPTTLERPVTDWLVVVERVMKGRIAASRIVVRLPGGVTPDGRRLHIFGTPPLAPGRRAILFLTPGLKVWRVVHFPQGAFVEVPAGTRRIAWRDFSNVLVLRGTEGTPDRQRDATRFADWIEDRASGVRRPADYFVAANDRVSPAFAFFEDSGFRFRWFQFDTGGSVTFRSGDAGQPGLPGGGATEVQRALAVWTNEPTTPIRLVYGGVSGLRGGTKNNDGFNVLLWNDPTNEIEGRYDCSEGGTLAHGGPWGSSPRANFDGRSYWRIIEGDVVFNDGIECLAAHVDFSRFIERVAAHEIGHTLGLHHSSENPNEPNAELREALMYYRIQGGNAGARLNSDDIGGLQTLYRVGGAGGGGGGGGTTKGCPAGTPPGTLCLLQGRFRVSATWENQFDGSSGSAGAVPSTDLAGFLYFADPGNLELAVKIVDFGSEIKVFYSQLTNLRFTLTVNDTASGRTKTYSNTPGDCGAIDNDFLSGAAAAASVHGAVTAPSVANGKCVADATTLCLLDNRFAISVDWRNQFDGSAGAGKPKPLSKLTGAFAFADLANLELLIKTLDFGDHQLVLYGALSNLEYTIRVTEAATGRTKSYHNPAGNYCGGIDENF